MNIKKKIYSKAASLKLDKVGFAFLCRQTIVYGFRYFIVLPSVAVAVIAAIGSQFNFTNFFRVTYEWVSEVSQTAAESPNHINVTFCEAYSPEEKTDADILPPPSKCEKWGLRSVLIESEAANSANIALRIYLFLVSILATFDVATRAMFGGYPSRSFSEGTILSGEIRAKGIVK